MTSVEAELYIVTMMLKSDASLKQTTKLTVDDIKQLIELCLSKCYFLWNYKIYSLESSAPIGLALMVVMAEAFQQYYVKYAIEEASRQTPPVARKSFLYVPIRYVDDSHAWLPMTTRLQSKRSWTNKKNIKYTIETKHEKSLQFLDL